MPPKKRPRPPSRKGRQTRLKRVRTSELTEQFEQFCYLRQSAPDKYPCDQIHWELWLRASANFQRSQSITNKPQTSTRQHFRSNFFPRGTCWAFHAGKHCQGCQFEHICYKCGAKHPAIQCSVQTSQHGKVTNKNIKKSYHGRNISLQPQA